MIKQLFFEDIKKGDQIAPLTEKITLVRTVMYSAVTWDFVRLHYDKEFAQSKGFAGPFVDGQMWGSMLARMLTDWFGPEAMLKNLKITFRTMAFPGDEVVCRGKVTDKYVKNKEKLIECELWIENQKGEMIVSPATATVDLPSPKKCNSFFKLR